MKLQELVKKYKGTARFDVNEIVDDNIQDVIVFQNTEVDALKDRVLTADVVRFMVYEIVSGVPVIKVDVRESVSVPNEGNTGDASDKGGAVE